MESTSSKAIARNNEQPSVAQWDSLPREVQILIFEYLAPDVWPYIVKSPRHIKTIYETKNLGHNLADLIIPWYGISPSFGTIATIVFCNQVIFKLEGNFYMPRGRVRESIGFDLYRYVNYRHSKIWSFSYPKMKLGHQIRHVHLQLDVCPQGWESLVKLSTGAYGIHYLRELILVFVWERLFVDIGGADHRVVPHDQHCLRLAQNTWTKFYDGFIQKKSVFLNCKEVKVMFLSSYIRCALCHACQNDAANNGMWKSMENLILKQIKASGTIKKLPFEKGDQI
jgi:hypothetical protein